MKSLLLIIALLLQFVHSAHANLVVNGDFSAGNSGFSSQYTPDSLAYSQGVYVMGTDPHLAHAGAASFGDHTTGMGLMMIVNGATVANQTLWREDIAVDPGTRYVFTGWVTTWGQYCCLVDPSPPVLQLFIDDIQVGSDYHVTKENGRWNQFSFSWISGLAPTASIRLVDSNLAAGGNDFALDDFSFSRLPNTVAEPDTAMLLAVALLGVAWSVRRQRGAEIRK